LSPIFLCWDGKHLTSVICMCAFAA
jgi:hypothetical protein